VESGGTKTQVFREYGTAFADGARWVKAGTPLTEWAGQTVRIVFEATDGGPDNLIEAGVDDVHVEQP
jgi:aminopeptidase S